MKSVCVIPSRAGIKHKGLWRLKGRTLVDWALAASKDYPRLITTDEDALLDPLITPRRAGVVYHRRPSNLCADPLMAEAVVEALDGYPENTIVHLCQPTSPFLRPSDIQMLDQALKLLPKFRSAQTVVEVPHNHHELNQRTLSNGCVSFINQDRYVLKTKQQKPKRYAFGNLVSVKLSALRTHLTFFPQPSWGCEIARPFGHDVDTWYDLQIAEAMIQGGIFGGIEECEF